MVETHILSFSFILMYEKMCKANEHQNRLKKKTQEFGQVITNRRLLISVAKDDIHMLRSLSLSLFIFCFAIIFNETFYKSVKWKRRTLKRFVWQ